MPELITTRNSDHELGLRTYYAYISSWVNICPDDITLIHKQQSLPGFQRLQGGVDPGVVRENLYRGLLTLEAMAALPIDTHPELATSANFWAPVQAYYVVHGLGMAVLCALGAGTPRKHRKFRSLMSSHVIRNLLPPPFNVLCLGDPFQAGGRGLGFHNYNESAANVFAVSNLTHNLHGQAANLLTGKCLSTTRRRALDDLFEDHRAGGRQGRRRNLGRTDRTKLVTNLHPTSIVDFLYRVRVRSNYDDPEMFIYGQTDISVAVNHYKNILNLLGKLERVLRSIIEKKVGMAVFQNLMSRFSVRN